MAIFEKSPFNSDKPQKNPDLFGLRERTIEESIYDLYNNKSILITGSRGIGKSSFSYQLQNILNGDYTLLTRCGVDPKLPKYITVFYVCESSDTLESLIKNIIKEIENKFYDLKPKSQYKFSAAELYTPIFKIKIEKEEEQENNNQLLRWFVEVIGKLNQMYEKPYINIAIDELDQLDAKHNLVHFLKVILEKLNAQNINILSFILSGQSSLIETFHEQQPSFFRLVKQFELQPLKYEDSMYVFDACIKTSKIHTDCDKRADTLLVELSSGFPFSIQILGHEAYNCMLKRYNKVPLQLQLTVDDAFNGIKNALKSFETRFDLVFSKLDADERTVIDALMQDWDKNNCKSNNIQSNKIIAQYDAQSIEKLSDSFTDLNIEAIINQLCKKQILVQIKQKASLIPSSQNILFQFKEELFRIHLSWNMKNIGSINNHFED